MESSLASLFMEGNLPCLPLSWATSEESVQDQLTSTSLELQNVQEAARSQSKIDEAKICCLQDLLIAARKERDEARTKCSKLQEFLLRVSCASKAPLPTAELPSSSCPSSISSTSAGLSHPTSPTVMVDGISLQDVRQTVQADKGIRVLEPDTSMKLLPHQTPDVQNICQRTSHLSTVAIGDSQQEFNMDFLSEDVCLGEDFIDLHLNSSMPACEENQSSKSSWNAHLSHDSEVSFDKGRQQNSISTDNQGNMLLGRSSSTSSAGSECLGGSDPSKSPSTFYKQPVTLLSKSLPLQSSYAQSPSLTMFHSSHMNEVCSFLNHTSQQSGNATHWKPCSVEISETEADIMQVDALPEKGKFLQAVIQAGPLLQNLLLAGPLPQWRYPPPQLSTVDIPIVPLPSGSLLMKHHSSLISCNRHAMPINHNSFIMDYTALAGHGNAPQMTDEKGLVGMKRALPKRGRSYCNGVGSFANSVR